MYWFQRLRKLFVLSCLNVLGTLYWANRQSTTDKKAQMICQVDTIDLLHEKHSLSKPPHAFGSELVKQSETEKAC